MSASNRWVCIVNRDQSQSEIRKNPFEDDVLRRHFSGADACPLLAKRKDFWHTDGMKNISIRLGSDSADDASERTFLWQDITADDEELPVLLDEFDLPQPVQEAMLENQHFPEATFIAGRMILRLPMRHVWNATAPVYVTFLALPDMLVTFRREQTGTTLQHGDTEENTPLAQLRDRLKEGDGGTMRNIPALIAYLLDGIVDANIRFFTRARIEAEMLSERLDEAPASVSENDVLDIRRRVSRLTSQFEDQFYSLTSLQTLHAANSRYPFLIGAIKDIADAQGHLVRSILRLEMRLRDIQQHCQYLVQRRTEQRLRHLTVLSAVYMPLTLITSLYGMNFRNMPELEWEYGYFAVISGMALVAVALILLFQHKGWFR